MSRTVCLWANDALTYPQGGGHIWVYLNWALGLRGCGCDVIWLERAPRNQDADALHADLLDLKRRLNPYGLAEWVALVREDAPLPDAVARECLGIEAAVAADLLLNFSYSAPGHLVRRFRRSVLVDIDPGLTQLWMSSAQISVAPHDLYLTIGETVGRPSALFPNCGLSWVYTPPCVALDWWPVRQAPNGAPYTTVSQWYGREWLAYGDQSYSNDKRDGFLPFLDLPRRSDAQLELALNRAGNDEWRMLQQRGWSVREAVEVSSSPWDYQAYVQGSRGEFSCVKPSCVRLGNAWISDRTLCYLASGKPAIVEYTGASRFLPDAEGLLRFRTIDEAVARLEQAEADYDHHCGAARALAQEHFDASNVARRVLERCLS